VTAILAVPAFALTSQINVNVKDGSCSLALTSSKTPNTAILFHLINNGTVAHGLMIWGVKSTMVPPKQSANVLVNFHKIGTYHYACTTGNYKHPATYGKGVFKIKS
jgi:hypothetical protein